MSKDSSKTGEHPTTTVAPSKAVLKALHQDPEFVDCKGLESLFGIRRSLAYQLLKDRSIKSVSLRRWGQVRGKRLFDVASVRAFLRSQMEGGAE